MPKSSLSSSAPFDPQLFLSLSREEAEGLMQWQWSAISLWKAAPRCLQAVDARKDKGDGEPG